MVSTRCWNPPASRTLSRLASPATRRASPCLPLVDVFSGQVVTNDYPQMTLDLSDGVTEHPSPWSPRPLSGGPAPEIDEVADLVYRDVNNGVYAAGFSRSQDAYEAAYTRLFDRLDWLSGRLTGQRFLVGDTITEADVRLLHHLCPLRRRLPRPLQVQPEQARRDAQPVGLRPGPVPDARVR